MRFRIFILMILGFFLSSILFMSLSIFTILFKEVYLNVTPKISIDLFQYLFTITYFSGMPLGKLIGRVFGLHKNAPLNTFIMVSIISVSILILYITTNLYIAFILRVIQGMSTFLMEIFSIEFSSILEFRERIIPSSISIGGIPTGIALGSLLISFISIYLILSWSIITLALGIAFSFVLKSAIKENPNNIKLKKKSISFFLNPLIWIMGLIWMSIAGFNLSLAVIIPIYLESTKPNLISFALGIFGYFSAAFTIIGGIIAYIIYIKMIEKNSIINFAIFSYLVSIIGFVGLIFLKASLISYCIIFISFEAMGISVIYSIPRDLFGYENYANATWEFSFLGSLGHIIAPLLVIPIAIDFGFRYTFLIYSVFPIIASLLFLRIKSYMIKGVVGNGIIERNY